MNLGPPRDYYMFLPKANVHNFKNREEKKRKEKKRKNVSSVSFCLTNRNSIRSDFSSKYIYTKISISMIYQYINNIVILTGKTVLRSS